MNTLEKFLSGSSKAVAPYLKAKINDQFLIESLKEKAAAKSRQESIDSLNEKLTSAQIRNYDRPEKKPAPNSTDLTRENQQELINIFSKPESQWTAIDRAKVKVYTEDYPNKKPAGAGPKANTIDSVDLATLRGRAADDARTSLQNEFHTNPTMDQQIANIVAAKDNPTAPPPYPPGRAPKFEEISNRADSSLGQMLGIPMSDVRVGGMNDQYIFDVLNKAGTTAAAGYEGSAGNSSGGNSGDPVFQTQEDVQDYVKLHPEKASLLTKKMYFDMPKRMRMQSAH